MAAITRTPRNRWIEEGLRALAAGGPDAVRIEVLAQALGVTKGGFYGHFADRDALLEEMLDSWERMSIDEVLERVEFMRDACPVDGEFHFDCSGCRFQSL